MAVSNEVRNFRQGKFLILSWNGGKFFLPNPAEDILRSDTLVSVQIVQEDLAKTLQMVMSEISIVLWPDLKVRKASYVTRRVFCCAQIYTQQVWNF